MISEFEIRQLSLHDRRSRKKVEDFLALNELRLDEVDSYYGIFRLEEEEILAGGGLKRDIIKCVAVREDLREEHLFNMLVSHLMSVAREEGHFSCKVYTKPKNLAIFQSLGFKLIAQSPQALFMENSLTELNRYKAHLAEASDRHKGERRGLIIMNANPFTKGHRYLVETAAAQVDQLFVVVVKENRSMFDYKYRLEMVESGCADIANAHVLEGSDYQISEATFPTYFLKQVTDATDEHIRLDLDVCLRHIVLSLGITHRFVGSEPTDKLTARYNELMHEVLEPQGVEVVEVERLTLKDMVINASRVRQVGDLSLLFPTSVPFVLGVLAAQAMRDELNLKGKPGLIGPDDNGSHSDMNYEVMMRSINAIEPYLVKLAQLSYSDEMPAVTTVTSIGLQAESAMLEATGGVNTHKGAIFALGMMVAGIAHSVYRLHQVDVAKIREAIMALAKGMPATSDTHGAAVRQKHHVKGALDMALEGYAQLFEDWMPYFQQVKEDEQARLRLLLHIVSTLEDNNLYHRGGAELTLESQQRCAQVADNFRTEDNEALAEWMKKHNMSPGGSADMLALSLFAAHIIYNI